MEGDGDLEQAYVRKTAQSLMRGMIGRHYFISGQYTNRRLNNEN